ncbi:MAG: hypothetical protein JO326_14545, partial [Acetobacteraceae bacterium]|nr:hypothetical protein [Acetobacteraceae bacterium]
MSSDTVRGALASRRMTLKGALALAGTAALPSLRWHAAQAQSQPALGTYPAGSAGDSVFVGIAAPRTGTYAVPGEDEIKGCELAVEHLNAGDPLIRAISPHTTKGVLGKTVKYGVADNEAKPNT